LSDPQPDPPAAGAGDGERSPAFPQPAADPRCIAGGTGSGGRRGRRTGTGDPRWAGPAAGPALPAAASLGEVVLAQGGQLLAFLEEDVVHVQVQGVAETGQVEEELADLVFEHLATVLAHLALQVAVHILRELAEGVVGRDPRLAGFDRNAPTRGHGLEDRAVDPGAGLLELGDHVEDAPVPDQAPADGVLKLVVEEILQRLHSSSLQAPTVLPAVVGGRSS